MQPRISIIVPIYKVEPYLRRCVDSILHQTYQNLEVILVDDGSPDNCGAICDEYAAKDPRVRVIHKENGGLSDARNAGMAIMTGAYISFVDSDDALPADALEYMLRLAVKEQADLVIGENIRFEEELPDVKDEVATVSVRNREETMEDFFRNGCAAWGRLYRREIHEGILFPVGEINEDEAIVLKILDNCEKVVNTSAVVYEYRCRPESITTASFSEKKLDWAKHCRDNLAFVRERYPELEQLAVARYRASILWALTEIAISDGSFEKSVNELMEELRNSAWTFWWVPFAFWQDRIRMMLLLCGPFSLYRMFIRKKRGI